MRRRQGYTIIELLVAMALIMTIMAILSTAYVSGLDTFSRLKGIGDMSEKLRVATTILRRDLSADHFTGAARLSDPSFDAQPPREGFFQVINGGTVNEGSDGFGNPSLVATQDILYFSVKLRGNRQEDFFRGDPNFANATFFTQPTDATYSGYQWAEVCYYVLPIAGGTTTGPAPGQQLYALYRAERAIVANNTGLNGGNPLTMSIGPNGFNTPSSIQTVANRGLQIPASLTGTTDTLLLSDVLNFDVQVMMVPPAAVVGPVGGLMQGVSPFTDMNYDTANPVSQIFAVQIIIRVYDLKTRQSRQITLVQDL